MTITSFIILALFIALDFYAFETVKTAVKSKSIRIVRPIYWFFTILVVGMYILFHFSRPQGGGNMFWNYVFFSFIIGIILAKLFFVLFMLADDIRRGVKFLRIKLSSKKTANEKKTEVEKITRSEFLAKSAIIAGSVPFAALTFGIVSGAYDYRVRKTKLVLPNLPKSFEGMKIAQLSDIHSGSFFNKTAVSGGVDMLLAEKPDMVFFTGDLVNYSSIELKEYFDIFKKVQAPLGVYSTLGNHDYGDYVKWPSAAAKQKDLETLMDGHRLMGWNLMMNENKLFEQGGDKIAVVGVENYGKGRFPKYGKLAEAVKNTDEAQVKLLLSHDPSHFDLEVTPQYKDIDVTFSGHTHGMQFGVEIGGFKWSPVKYMYEKWAGLYKEGDQQLYVNRGYGFIGFPGRVGILPEIAVFELTRG